MNLNSHIILTLMQLLIHVMVLFYYYFGCTKTYCIHFDKNISFFPFKSEPQIIQFAYKTLCKLDVISY